jgi:DNA-binding MarR family transcriptional regulator
MAFDLDRIDDVIHGRLRLGIMAYLSSAEAAEFTELRVKLGTTDGNLSAHVRKLEDAGYVAVEKAFAGRKPVTRIAVTASGRRAYAAYLQALAEVVGRLG